MHCEHWGTDVNRLHTGLCSDDGSDGAATSIIIAHDELLKRNVSSLGDALDNGEANGISCVPLISVYFKNNALMNFRHVVFLMAVRIVRVDCVGHIGGQKETLANSHEVILANSA